MTHIFQSSLNWHKALIWVFNENIKKSHSTDSRRWFFKIDGRIKLTPPKAHPKKNTLTSKVIRNL